MKIRFFFFVVILSFFSGSPALAQENFDLLILNGRVMDGTGNPWYYADIAVRADQIVKIGRITERNAKTIIDAKGLTVCPGFIDIHSHADDTDGDRNGIRADHPMMKAAHNLVLQGVTTVVVNHDGRSQPSIVRQRQQMESQGIGPNVALLVGHNTIRFQAMGDDYQRFATPEEIEKMKAMIRQGMEEGAFGLSAGLEYVPGRWSNTEEVIELVREVKPWGGVYIVHERFSGSDPMWYQPSRDGKSPGTALDHIQETIRIADETGVTTCASHIKVKGADYWGVAQAMVNLIDRARNRGVDIWADQYPYNTTGTDGNTVLIPNWIAADPGKGTTYRDAFEMAWAVDSLREDLILDISREIERRGGAENIVVFDFPDSTFIGLSLYEIAVRLETSPLEAALWLQRNGDPNRRGGGRLRGFSLNEADIELFAAQPWTITASDAGIAPVNRRSVHARYYGTFPRKIAWYARQRKVLSVEDAVRSSTSLPAQFMGFSDRGLLREGYKADLIIIDLENFEDKATFFDPHQYPEGMHHVIVNGRFLVRDGKLTEELPGKVLTNRESYRNR